jgi:hypothetical protein
VPLFFDFERFLDVLLFDLLDGFFCLLPCVMVLHAVMWIHFQTTFS